MNASSTFLWMQVNFLLPPLLVMLVAFGLAIVNLQRAPTAALLVLLGAGLTILLMVGAAVIQYVLLNGDMNREYTPLLRTMTIVISWSRAVGLLLIVIGVFVDRAPRANYEDVYQKGPR